jgi:hypothetical protein
MHKYYINNWFGNQKLSNFYNVLYFCCISDAFQFLMLIVTTLYPSFLRVLCFHNVLALRVVGPQKWCLPFISKIVFIFSK